MVFRSQMTLPKSIYAWAQYSSKKNNYGIYGWILGVSKIPNTKNVKETTLEKKKLIKKKQK